MTVCMVVVPSEVPKAVLLGGVVTEFAKRVESRAAVALRLVLPGAAGHPHG